MSEPTKEQIQIVFKKLKQNRYNKVYKNIKSEIVVTELNV